MKTVWVLGAGFSKPLGAPLLYELYSQKSVVEVQAAYSHLELDDYETQIARRLYAHCHADKTMSEVAGSKRGTMAPTLWSNAEQFLDRLDCAWWLERNTTSGEQAGILKEQISMLEGTTSQPYDFSKVVHGARRWMAAECCAFLENADLTTEQWSPFVDWFSGLEDTRNSIITFNYDRVLEVLCEKTQRENSVVVPRRHVTTEAVRQIMDPGFGIPILKLHGSVSWRRVDFDVIEDASTAALQLPPEEIVLATPGRTKKDTVASSIKILWASAHDRLLEATRIVFVGYRFPETDAEALTCLLDAISLNMSHQLTIETVLGPSSRDAPRLHALLQTAVRGREKEGLDPAQIVEQPLYSQDYFALSKILNRHDGRTTS